MNTDLDDLDIERLVGNREEFDSFVYTPASRIINTLKERSAHKEMVMENESLNKIVPEFSSEHYHGVIFRHICTPNNEFNEFISHVSSLGIKPMIGEFLQDKFTPNNLLKYNLGRMSFYEGVGRNGGIKIDYENIIEFNYANGKPLSVIRTKWGQMLVDFHHEILLRKYPFLDTKIFFDASAWLFGYGKNAKEYYEQFLMLFLKNAVLFENFSLGSDEVSFTKEIFLPAFVNIIKKTGLKPMITAIEPTIVEDNIYWLCYPDDLTNFVKDKKNKLR